MYCAAEVKISNLRDLLLYGWKVTMHHGKAMTDRLIINLHVYIFMDLRICIDRKRMRYLDIKGLFLRNLQA